MIGLALLAIGAVLVWAAFTARGQAVVDALQIKLPGAQQQTAGGPASSGDSSGSGGTPFNPADAAAATQNGPGGLGGTFQGASGKQYGGSYASLTPAQRDDVNAFANHTSNTGG